jgi:hypothetical protein
VSQVAKPGLWRVSLKASGRKYSLDSLRDEESAAIARDRLALHLWGKAAQLNFPKRKLKSASYAQLQLELREQRTASKYRGVTFDSNVQRFQWAAEITLDYEKVFLGRFATERDAAIAYDRAALRYLDRRAKPNLPKVSRAMGPATAEQLRREARAELKKLMHSRFRGVKPNHNLWSARIRHRGKEICLGSFVDDEDAARAYDKGGVEASRGEGQGELGPSIYATAKERRPITASKSTNMSAASSAGEGLDLLDQFSGAIMIVRA